MAIGTDRCPCGAPPIATVIDTGQRACFSCAMHAQIEARSLRVVSWDAIPVAPGIFRLEDEHCVYAVPSASTDRIHQVTVNTRTGAMRCDGPHCDARTCSHQKRVRAARAGF